MLFEHCLISEYFLAMKLKGSLWQLLVSELRTKVESHL